MNVEGTNYFSDDGEDGILEVRYIREYGLCICTKHEGKNYFFPMIAMEDKASFSNVFSDIVSDYDVKLKQAIKGLNEHKEKNNGHDTKLFDLKDLERTFINVETVDSDGVGTGIFYKEEVPFEKYNKLVYDDSLERFVAKKSTHDHHMHVKAFDIAGGSSQALDMSSATLKGYNSFIINVTGLGVYTITDVSNLTAFEKYTFTVKNGSNNVVIKYNASSIRTPKQADVTLEEYSVITFWANSVAVMSCTSLSDNKT